MKVQRSAAWILSSAILVFSTEYYVSTNGNDGASGSSSAPLAHIMAAIDRCGPGDVITVKNGTYSESVVFNKSGNPGNPIVLQGEDKDKVIIDGQHSTQFPLLFQSGNTHDVLLRNMTFKRANAYAVNSGANVTISGNHWYVSNVSSLESKWDGIILCGDNNTLDSCVAAYNFAGGISGGGTNLLVKNCKSHHNNPGWAQNPFPAGSEGIVLWDSAGGGDGLYHVALSFTGGGGKFHNVTNGPITFDNFEAFENHGAGLWFDWDNHNITIRNSYFHDNRKMIEGWEGIGFMTENNPNANMVIDSCVFSNNECAQVLCAETQNFSIRHSTIEGGQFEFRDMLRSLPGVPDADVTMDITAHDTVENNTFINASIWANFGCENWDGTYAANHDLVIRNNSWQGSIPQVLWGWSNNEPNWYEGLDTIRSSLGICINDTWQESQDPQIAVRPLRSHAPQKLFEGPVPVYDLQGRLMFKSIPDNVWGRMNSSNLHIANGLYVFKTIKAPRKMLW
jgi:hypothetical protein